MRQRIDILDTTIVYIEILRFLPKRKFISAQDINQHLRSSGFERDIRSVQRILNKLSEHFDIERDDRSRPYGYKWKERAQGLALTILSEQDLMSCQYLIKEST